LNDCFSFCFFKKMRKILGKFQAKKKITNDFFAVILHSFAKKMKRSREEDVPEHIFEASDQELEAIGKLDTILETHQIRQIMFEHASIVWKVSPVLNHLFTSLNRFGINIFTTIFEDGKVNINISKPPDFSKFQLKKLQQHPSQVLVISNLNSVNVRNFLDIYHAIQYFFLIQKLLHSSKIYPLVDSVMCFLQFRCTSFYFVKDQQLRIHDKYIQEKKDAKMQEERIRKLMESYT
jgi:hypothetical protein